MLTRICIKSKRASLLAVFIWFVAMMFFPATMFAVLFAPNVTLTGDLNFGTVLYRADSGAVRFVTVANSGTEDITGLERTYPGDMASVFTLGAFAAPSNFVVSDTMAFSVQPVFGLNADGVGGSLYSRDITISAPSGVSQTITAQIHVSPRIASAPSVPNISAQTHDSITISPITPPWVYWYVTPIPANAGWTAEYRLYAADGTTVVRDWQVSNVFTGLDANTTYRARARFAANDASNDFPDGRNHVTVESGLTANITTETSAACTISVTGSLDFGTLEFGEAQPAPRTVTVTNTGVSNVTMAALPTIPGWTLTPSGNWTTAFAPNEIRTFTIVTNANLPVGAYSPIITLSTITSVSATVNPTFTIVERTTHAPVITIDAQTTNSITVSANAPRYSPTQDAWVTQFRLLSEDGSAIIHDWQTHGAFTGLTEDTPFRVEARFMANDSNHVNSAMSAENVATTASSQVNLTASPAGRVFAPNTVAINAIGNNIASLEYFVLKTDDTVSVTDSNFSTMYASAVVSGAGVDSIIAHLNGIYWVRITFANGETLIRSIRIDNIYTPSLFVRGVSGIRELYNERVTLAHGLPLEYDGSLVGAPSLGFVEIVVTAQSIAGYTVQGSLTQQIRLNCVSFATSPGNTITFYYIPVWTEPENNLVYYGDNIVVIPPSQPELPLVYDEYIPETIDDEYEPYDQTETPPDDDEVDVQVEEDDLDTVNEEDPADTADINNEPDSAESAEDVADETSQPTQPTNDTSHNAVSALNDASDVSHEQPSYETTDSVVNRRMVTFALSQIENTWESTGRFSIVSRPSRNLRFYRGEVPAFAFGDGITYAIHFRTRGSASNRVFMSGIPATEPFYFYNTTGENWTEIILLFEQVPKHFAHRNVIYFTFEVVGESYFHEYGLLVDLPNRGQIGGFADLRYLIETLRNLIQAATDSEIIERLNLILADALAIYNDPYATEAQALGATEWFFSVVNEINLCGETCRMVLGGMMNLFLLLGGVLLSVTFFVLLKMQKKNRLNSMPA